MFKSGIGVRLHGRLLSFGLFRKRKDYADHFSVWHTGILLWTGVIGIHVRFLRRSFLRRVFLPLIFLKLTMHLAATIEDWHASIPFADPQYSTNCAQLTSYQQLQDCLSSNSFSLGLWHCTPSHAWHLLLLPAHLEYNLSDLRLAYCPGPNAVHSHLQLICSSHFRELLHILAGSASFLLKFTLPEGLNQTVQYKVYHVNFNFNALNEIHIQHRLVCLDHFRSSHFLQRQCHLHQFALHYYYISLVHNNVNG